MLVAFTDTLIFKLKLQIRNYPLICRGYKFTFTADHPFLFLLRSLRYGVASGYVDFEL